MTKDDIKIDGFVDMVANACSHIKNVDISALKDDLKKLIEQEDPDMKNQDTVMFPHYRLFDIMLKKLPLDSLVVRSVSDMSNLVASLTNYSLRSGKEENFDAVCENLAKVEVAVALLKRKFQTDKYQDIVDDKIGALYKEFVVK